MKRCFIFGAISPENLFYEPKPDDFVIAADKGVEVIKRFDIYPDVIIGDFDSLGYTPKGENVKKLPVEKDDTDIGYAIKYALLEGYTDFVIYGGIGGLLDHTLANIQLCAYVSKRGGRAVFIGDGVFVTAITDSAITLENLKGRVSVFSADSLSNGVSISGMKYNLEDVDLSSDFPLGVSNEAKDDTATVSVKSGTLIITTQSKI